MAGKVWKVPAAPPKMKYVAPDIDYTSGGAKADEEVFFSLQTKGFAALMQNLNELPNIAQEAVGNEMANIAGEIIEDAKENYVPFRTGNLKDSGQSDAYERDINGVFPTVLQIGMWFGAPLTREQQLHGLVDVSSYAARQHEEITWHHEPPPDQTGAKYLERPFMKMEPRILPRLAGAIVNALGIGAPAY